MQWIDLQEVLIKFSLDVDLCQFCEDLMDIKHWMGASCHISCEILDVEGLHATMVKPLATLTQDEE